MLQRFKERSIIIIIPILVIATVVSMIALQGQTRDKTSTSIISPEPQNSPSLNREMFPMIEYSSLQRADNNRKAAKYDKAMSVLSSDLSKDVESVVNLHWEEVSALPNKESSVIVIGRVVELTAHLSLSKLTVYSEINIEIEEVLKNANGQILGKNVTAEREGGVVLYPSGFKLWHHVGGQHMPAIGSRYLFFLTNNFPSIGSVKEDLYLITAYELRKEKVFPLDNPGESHKIVLNYKGKPESVLIGDLRKVLND